MTMLDVKEAAVLIGVPENQLKIWASVHVGPRFEGSRLDPKYRQGDVEEWLRVNAPWIMGEYRHVKGPSFRPMAVIKGKSERRA